MPRTQINRVVLLVHPGYSFFLEVRHLVDNKTFDRKQAVRNLNLLAGIWGKEIVDAEKDPHAMVIILKDTKLVGQNPKGFFEKVIAQEEVRNRFLRNFPESEPGVRMLARLITRARKNLGNRLVEMDDLIDAKTVSAELKKRGLFVGTALTKNRSFGEWFEQCVQEGTRIVARRLGIPISIHADKSVSNRQLVPSKGFSGLRPAQLLANKPARKPVPRRR